MAMRPVRGGRANIPNRPPRLVVGRSYEQFKPMSEWRQEDDHDTLLVYLPGFQKEYVKVTTEDLNIVRVRGMRQIEGNRWSRFQEDYRVPENCEMRGIRARFDGGILTITMPRKIINAPPTPTTVTQSAPKTKEEPLSGTKQEKASSIPTAKEEPKEKKPDYKPPLTTPFEANTLPPQVTPAASSSTPAAKQEPLKPTPAAENVVESTIGSLPKYSAPKKDRQDVVEKPIIGEKMDFDHEKGKEFALLEEETKRDVEGSKRKPGGYDVGRRSAGMVMMNEDRKALVNVGVGILVIVALGVQVSYTIGLIGKGK